MAARDFDQIARSTLPVTEALDSPLADFLSRPPPLCSGNGNLSPSDGLIHVDTARGENDTDRGKKTHWHRFGERISVKDVAT